MDSKDTKGKARPAEEADVEGHNMWISPTISRDMANSRSKDIEREAKARQREKDSKGR